MTFDQFMKMPGSKDYELVEGRLVERHGHGARASEIGVRAATALMTFVRRTNAGHLFGSGAPYHCFGHNDTVRRPGVTFIQRGRLPDERIPEGPLEIPADLLIRMEFPTEPPGEAEATAAFCLRHGFHEAWVIQPDLRIVRVLRRGRSAVRIPSGGALTGVGPLAEFACPIDSLFSD